MLVVVAAGNSATAAELVPKQRRNVPPGYVELFSVESPATAKNALTVGASRSDRDPP
jgi:serine protease AprX